MDKRVVISGLGVISSIGIGWEMFWDNLLMGKSGINPVVSFDTTQHFTHNGGEVNNFRPELFMAPDRLDSLSRATQLALAATKLAVNDANLSTNELSSIKAGVCLGTTMGSVQSSEMINELIVLHGKKDLSEKMLRQVATHSTSAAVAHDFSLSGPNMMFSTACSAGNYAIGYGFDLIKYGKADVVLAGGADPFSRVAFTGFNQFSAVAPEKCQPFDKERKGMIVAEGAGVIVLESLEHAIKRRANLYAEILGYGLSCDAFHMTASTQEGIAQCMRKAIREAEITPEDVDYISAHGTGTLTNDRNESAAIKNIFGARYKKIPVSSVKSMIGHTMGAASALEAIVCAMAVQRDIIPPTTNFNVPDPECDIDCVPNVARKHVVNIALNNSYAFGGNNACLILKKIKTMEK